MPLLIHNRRPTVAPRPLVPVVPRAVLGSPTHVVGMHGMGDNLHMRALLKWLLKSPGTVYLETPWPSIFHDLVGPKLKLVRKPTRLRTQAKNAEREADKYDAVRPTGRQLRVWYSRDDVIKHGSVLGGMMANAKCPERDFSLPIPDQWVSAAAQRLRGWGGNKPLMVYRPLVMRTEWSGCAARNPDAEAYDAIFQSIRDKFFVVSVADLVPNVEWVVGKPAGADLHFHRGELPFEALAALVQRASLTYASPGFLTILAQAVGTPSVCVFGGYEDGHSFQGGAQLAPHLAIDPITPCQCFQHKHACQKEIDVPKAVERIKEFTKWA